MTYVYIRIFSSLLKLRSYHQILNKGDTIDEPMMAELISYQMFSNLVQLRSTFIRGRDVHVCIICKRTLKTKYKGII